MTTATRLAMGLSVAGILVGLVGCTSGASRSDGAPVEKTAPADDPKPAASTAAEAQAAPTGAPAAEPQDMARRGRAAKGAAPSRDDRPGLATQWGESRTSRINTVSFTRASTSSPFATSSLFYNDERGARAMASTAGFHRTSSGEIRVADGAFTMSLRDGRGRFLSGYHAEDKDFIVGESGQRYTIVLKNQTDFRFEAVVSVDGLDVMDGKSASVEKRGYLVDPHGELEIDGFRQSEETVAAFRFGSVKDSYANKKHGDTRNVGVIGVALFHERGTNPFAWASHEVAKRRDANPFPGSFASPP